MPHESILQAAQAELSKHAWDTFVAQGGKGIVTPGCKHCRKQIFTVNQFIDHLAVDVLPGIIERAMQIPVRQMQGFSGC